MTYEEFGETKNFDLVPDGGDVNVNGANRQQYVELYTKYLLDDSIARQFAAFMRGFHSVLSRLPR